MKSETPELHASAQGTKARVPRLLWCGLIALLLPVSAQAHIGSPNVFFEGMAGRYPVHVVIRPAEVVPGLAEISVRVDADNIQRVSALPIKWNAGRKGAPPPDIAKLVPGETNLYSAQLWFMEPGAQSVELELTGASGTGRVTIPVDAIARRVLAMPEFLGGLLVVLGVVLVSLLLSVVGAAVRESVLSPGLAPPLRRRWWARGAMALGAVVICVLLWGGKRWWEAEAADYRNNRLYQALDVGATVRVENHRRLLRLEINDLRFVRYAPLVPDHGKLMHLFLVREPALDAFAHLHPVKRDRQNFEALLPDLPPGSYRLYADVTYETGYSDTLTTEVTLPEAPGQTGMDGRARALDPDDSWRVVSGLTPNSRACRLNADYEMTWSAPGNKIPVNQPLTLRFTVRDAKGIAVAPEPYLGMRGHLALRRSDGSVFTHLHPGGSASMAAMQLAVLRTEGKLPLNAAFGESEPICQLPTATSSDQQWLGGFADGGKEISFPYAFPKPGHYRLWVQVRINGEVLTGVFDADVGAS